MLQTADYLNLANAFVQGGQVEKALWCYDQIPPEWVERHVGKASLLCGQRKFDEAKEILAKELTGEWGNHPETILVKGWIALKELRLQDAEALYRDAIADRPHETSYWVNLGHVLQLQNRYTEAGNVYLQASQLFPQEFKLRTYFAMTRMLTGDWGVGLNAYEARLMHDRPFPNNGRPIWTGERLKGKTLAIYHEQGLGDGIQFIRYASQIKSAFGAKRIVLICRDPLYRLMQYAEGVDEVVTPQSSYPEYDYHVAMMSILNIFHRTYGLGAMWGTDRYLRLSRQRPQNPKFRVGFCWKGSKGHATDEYRSIDPELMKPLFKMAGQAVSLQYDEPEKAKEYGMETTEMVDLLDTAKVLQGLDLVVTVDTAVGHLAGALGVPVHVFIPAWSDWRYGTSGSTTKWYESMRLFRAAAAKEWELVIKSVGNHMHNVKFMYPECYNRNEVKDVTSK